MILIFLNCQVGLPFRCVTLEQQKGERAMLIRNARGDWGIVKTQWICFRRGYIPEDDGKKQSPIHLTDRNTYTPFIIYRWRIFTR